MTSDRSTVAAALLVLIGLASGCSAAEDKAKEAVGDAACSIASKAVSGVTGQVDDAVDEIGADPKAAEQKLRRLRDAVKSAEGRIGGGTKQKLSGARGALDDLVDEAGDAADGAEVDTGAVDEAKGDFDVAVDDVRDHC